MSSTRGASDTSIARGKDLSEDSKNQEHAESYSKLCFHSSEMEEDDSSTSQPQLQRPSSWLWKKWQNTKKARHRAVENVHSVVDDAIAAVRNAEVVSTDTDSSRGLSVRVFASNNDAAIESTVAFVSRRMNTAAPMHAGMMCCARGSTPKDLQDMADARILAKAAAPAMEDIMNSNSIAPFTLELFRLWSEVNLVAENVTFLQSLSVMRNAPINELTIRARAVLGSFVRLGSENEVNLSDSTRREVITAVTQLAPRLDRALQSRRCAAQPGAYRRASYTARGPPLHAPRYDLAADETVARLAHELRFAFSPAERAIYNMVSLDAHPRFISAVTASLVKFAAGKKSI